MAQAVGYMRYSSHNQNETSIERQREKIEAYCKDHGIQLLGEYVDIAHSAKYDTRPAFQRLIADAARRPTWDTILVYDLSRYSRNSKDAMYYEDLFSDYGIYLTSISQHFSNDVNGRFAKKVTYLVDEMSSLTNGKTTHDSMMNKAKKGTHCGGKPPLGYDVGPDKHLVINEVEAETVQKIFNMVEQDYSYAAIARLLNADGRRTKFGKPFTKHSFSDLLQNEKYTGMYIWNRGKGKNSKGTRNGHASKPLDQQVRIDDGCPQIITPEQFERVQEKLRSRAGGCADSKRRTHYMLSGLKVLKCANCGAYMIGTVRSSHGNKYTTYYCPNRKRKGCETKEIRTELVDEMVAGHIMRDLYNRKDHPLISTRLQHNDSYKRLLNKQRGVEKAIGNVMKGIEESCSPTLIARLNELEAEKASLEQALNNCQLPVAGIDDSNRKAVCKRFGQYLRVSEDPDVKTYLTSVIQEVLVSNDDVTIKLKIA